MLDVRQTVLSDQGLIFQTFACNFSKVEYCPEATLMRNYETRHQMRKIPFPNEDFKTVIAVSSDRFYPKSQKANAI